jgi:hypothetical protein
VFAARIAGEVGVKVAVAPEQATVPVTAPAVAVTVNVDVVRVEQFKAAPA